MCDGKCQKKTVLYKVCVLTDSETDCSPTGILGLYWTGPEVDSELTSVECVPQENS